ncbi:MAG TPA: post-COAP-1 domain-containing protein, partial [Candidatus Methanoperedens sp.]
EDLNANGKIDSFETGLAGWEININGTDTITGKEVNITTTTDTNGNYSFTNLTAGTYIISEKLNDGWVQTTPMTGTYTVTITSGANITGQDFGNFHRGKITGGGWISVPGDPKATYGLEGQYPDSSSNTAQGNVEYQDHALKLKIKSVKVNTVATTIDKKRGVITGLAQVNGAGTYYFEAYVEDNGEPGKGVDVFKISLPIYPYSNGAILSSGNIQIHK